MGEPRPIARDFFSESGAAVVARRSAVEACATGARGAVVHSHATLAFYTDGRSRIAQQGEWTVNAGDVMLVPAGAPHRMLSADRAAFWGLAFCVPCFASESAGALLAPFERVRDGGAAVVRIPAARHGYLETLFAELAATGTTRASGDAYAAVQRSLLTLILNEVDGAARALGTAPGARSSVVVDALRFIERNCLRKLSLDDVASAVRRTPAYVTSALTQATGKSAGAWIISGRMAEARRLLVHSDEHVDVIAERVGYADATHFIRMFRREHGRTPAAWRALGSR